MSFQVDTALVNAYKANIEIQFQQKGSRLRAAVRQESQHAEFDFYDRIGPVDAVEVTSRHGDTPLISTPHDRRRVSMRDFDWADMIDRPDKIRMLADPTSSYTQNAAYAFGRRVDDVIVEAAFGTAYTGKTGATSVTFPSASTVAVDYVESGSTANSNLTIAKLRRARYLLDANEAAEDGEELFAVIHAAQVQALLRQTEINSADYNTVKALVEGKVDTFMGFKFIRMNRLPKSGNVRSCLFFTRGALLLAMGTDLTVDVGPRRDKRNSVQVYACMSMGASRMWEEKTLKINCDESV